jgi:hypothetical protein
VSERALEVTGFRAAGVHCGIKPEALDLALLASDVPAAAAGVFTRSTLVGAPVELTRARVRSGRARAVVINSGVSNVAMGERGRRDARAMADEAGRSLGVRPEEVLVASTGVIGEPAGLCARRGAHDHSGGYRQGVGHDRAGHGDDARLHPDRCECDAGLPAQCAARRGRRELQPRERGRRGLHQ